MESLNVFFGEFEKETKLNTRIIMIWDQAGFYTSKQVKVPANVKYYWRSRRSDYLYHNIFSEEALISWRDNLNKTQVENFIHCLTKKTEHQTDISQDTGI